jgi:hypothetical protein
MFTHDQIVEIIDLSEKSYALLKWVGSSLKRGFLKFDVVHEAVQISEATKDWLIRHNDQIPKNYRPNRSKVDAFANFFSTYLMTSFELIEKPTNILKTDGKCFCWCCSYLAAGDNLKLRKITKNARKDAQELKRIYLTKLCDEIEAPLISSEINQILEDKVLYPSISLATYFCRFIILC